MPRRRSVNPPRKSHRRSPELQPGPIPIHTPATPPSNHDPRPPPQPYRSSEKHRDRARRRSAPVSSIDGHQSRVKTALPLPTLALTATAPAFYRASPSLKITDPGAYPTPQLKHPCISAGSAKSAVNQPRFLCAKDRRSRAQPNPEMRLESCKLLFCSVLY